MTNNEYTPTTAEVRNDYRFSSKRPDVCGKDFGDEFDRWLDATIRKAKAEALREAAAEIRAFYFGPDQVIPLSTGGNYKWGSNQAAKSLETRASRIEAGE